MVTQKFTEITESASGTGCALKSEAIISVISVNFCVTTFTKYKFLIFLLFLRD